MAKVNHTFDVQLTSAEQDYFTYYLASNAPRLVETGVSYISSNKIAQAIVEELLSTIKRTSNFDWVNDSLLIEDLTSHIEGFINMNLMDARRTNPLLTTIIKSFPLAYDLCLTHLNILGKKHGLYFSQDEIGYIALHIAGAMERSSMENVRKFQVILICGTGLAMSRIIEAKINKYYKNKIEVVDRLSYVELRQQDLTTIDFIITTVPLGKLSIPHIYINMAKLDIEINKIENFIDNFRENNEEVYSLFREEFFFCGEFKNKDDLLNRMTQKLNQSDFVSMDFYPSIMERESINQTNINEWLAIPHPMSLLAKRSTVAVGILKNGIDWGNGDLVQFVFLFAITKTDYKETEYIYDLLLSLMEHEDIRNKILEKNTFQNFITQIKKLK